MITDVDNFIEQAALFVPGGRVILIPRLPNESTSHVQRITNSGIVLVASTDNQMFPATTQYLYRHGTVTPLNVGSVSAVNFWGLVSGTLRLPAPLNADRAFRYNPRSGVLTQLNPLPTEPDSWGLGINSRGDVLGYSFINGSTERIGVWRGTRFKTYFVEGTPEFPTVSNSLLWNEQGLIVITRTTRNDLNSYVVPRPGVRVKLADITDVLPAWTLMYDINERGDILGLGGPEYFVSGQTFVLRRVHAGSFSTTAANASSRQIEFPSHQRKQCPQKIPPSLAPWCGMEPVSFDKRRIE